MNAQPLAFTPDKPNVPALDGTTGAYWFWDGMKWTKINTVCGYRKCTEPRTQRPHISQQIQRPPLTIRHRIVDDNNQQATDWLYGLEQCYSGYIWVNRTTDTAISDTADNRMQNEIALRLYLGAAAARGHT
ncbi:hypothetical protein ACKVB0_026950 [Klebsiella pneumoniae]